MGNHFTDMEQTHWEAEWLASGNIRDLIPDRNTMQISQVNDSTGYILPFHCSYALISSNTQESQSFGGRHFPFLGNQVKIINTGLGYKILHLLFFSKKLETSSVQLWCVILSDGDTWHSGVGRGCVTQHWSTEEHLAVHEKREESAEKETLHFKRYLIQAFASARTRHISFHKSHLPPSMPRKAPFCTAGVLIRAELLGLN